MTRQFQIGQGKGSCSGVSNGYRHRAFAPAMPDIPSWYLGSEGALPFTAIERTATANIALDALIVSASGTVVGTVDGTLAVTLDALTVTAIAQIAVQGTLAATLDALIVSASGKVDVQGTLAVTLDTLTVSASGTVVGTIDGTLAVTLDALTVSASGNVEFVNGSATTDALTYRVISTVVSGASSAAAQAAYTVRTDVTVTSTQTDERRVYSATTAVA